MHKTTPKNLFLTNCHSDCWLLNFRYNRIASENRPTDFIQFGSNLRQHFYAVPVLRRSEQHGENQFQTRLFRRKPWDDLYPSFYFAESSLQKICSSDKFVMLFRKFKMCQRFLKVLPKHSIADGYRLRNLSIRRRPLRIPSS